MDDQTTSDAPGAEQPIDAPADTTTAPDAPTPGAPASDQDALASVLGQITQRVEQQISGTDRLDFELPNVPNLWLRLKAIPFERIRAISKTVAEDANEDGQAARRELDGMVDTLVDACDMVMVKLPGAGLTAVDPTAASQGTPVRFDTRLAALLNLGEVTLDQGAREVAYRTFGRNAAAITRTYMRLSGWLEMGSKTQDKAALGES